MSSAVYLWKTFRAQAEQDSGVSQKVFGFSPESVFAFIPECCSESARNPVRLHPGIRRGLQLLVEDGVFLLNHLPLGVSGLLQQLALLHVLGRVHPLEIVVQ